MSCTICNHPKRQEIDQALLAGSASLNALCKEYGLSISALNRHQAHLQAKVSRGRDQIQHNLFQSCYFWLSQALEMAMQTAQTAMAEGNSKLVLQALAQGSRFIKIIQKQDFQLDDQMVCAILTSPQWAGQNTLLPHDPDIMAKSRQSLAGLFSAPCPEGPPPAVPSAAPAGQQLNALQAIPPAPAQTSAKTKKQKPQSEYDPSKWEEDENMPGTECYVYDAEEEYRLHEVEKKIAQLDIDAITRGMSPVAANEKFEAIFNQLWDAIPIPTDKPLSEYLLEMRLQTEQAQHNGQDVIGFKP
jgi:hypothetical protein